MTSSLTDTHPAWDYGVSVERVRRMVIKWNTLTVEILDELHQAREALSSHFYRDGQSTPSWDCYCREIGLVKRTANRWLSRYDPETGTIKELPEPEPVRAPVEAAVPEPQEAVVDAKPEKVLNPHQRSSFLSGKRISKDSSPGSGREPEPPRQEQAPSGMGDLLERIDEHLLRMREAAARFHHLTLAGGADNQVQSSMLDLVQRYVTSFEPQERRVEVAHNLIKAIRVLIHEINGEEASA